MRDVNRFNSRLSEPKLPRSSLIVWFLFALLAAFVAWGATFIWMK